MIGIISALIVIMILNMGYIVSKYIFKNRSISYLHILWIILFISTLIFRARTTTELVRNPLDAAGLFRVVLVGYTGYVLFIQNVLRRNILPLQKRDYIFYFLLLYIFIGFVSVVYSDLFKLSLYKSVELFVDLLLILTMRSYFSYDEVIKLFNIMLFLLGLLIVVAWVEVFFFPEWSILRDGPLNFMIRGYFPKQDVDMIAMNAEILFIVAFVRRYMGKSKTLYRLILLFATTALVLSESRTAVIGLIIIIFVLVFLLGRNYYYLYVGMALLVLWMISPFIINEFFKNIILENRSVENFQRLGGRVDWWLTGLQLLKESPLIGFGFSVGARIAAAKNIHFLISTFNNYIDLALNVGIIGAMFFIIAFYMVPIYFLRCWRILIRARDLLREKYYVVIEGIGIWLVIFFRTWTASVVGEHGKDMMIFLVLALVSSYTCSEIKKDLGRRKG